MRFFCLTGFGQGVDLKEWFSSEAIMNGFFLAESGNLVLMFKENEKKDVVTLLRYLVEDEREQGNEVPQSVTEESLEEFLNSDTEGLFFHVKYINLAIRFIEVVRDMCVEQGGNPAGLSQFLAGCENLRENYKLQ